jgi:flagellar basal-body rod modification protein FlgD
MDIQGIAAPPPRGAEAAESPTALGGADFLQLLVTQLQNQDPLEPTSNDDLLRQLSSIRDIELSTSLSESLQALLGNQRFGSAATLIGKDVTGRGIGESGGEENISGTVVGVRFGEDGKAVLDLDNGLDIALDKLDSIQQAQQSADSLVGRFVRGMDRTNPESPEMIEGVVTAVRQQDGGVALELDSGRTFLARDMVAAA